MSGAGANADIDLSDRAAFIERYGGIYEHSPWVAEAAFDLLSGANEGDAKKLAPLMASVVDRARDVAKLDLLRAHPDLAGRLALQGALTEASSKEQQSAGLDNCSPRELEQFQKFNERYKSKFGFPFILAVAGRNRAEILENFEARLRNSKDEEFATAMTEVHKIARIRLGALLDCELDD